MKMAWGSTINFFLVFLTLLLLAGFQSTFWYQFLGKIAAPMLWLNVLVFVMLYRRTLLAALSIYLMSYALLSFTSMPLEIMWISLILLFALVYLIKTRVFWSGPGYFTLISAFAVVAFHVIYFLCSIFIEKKQPSFEVMDRLIQFILTPTFAFPTYWLLKKIDDHSLDELTRETGGLEL